MTLAVAGPVLATCRVRRTDPNESEPIMEARAADVERVVEYPVAVNVPAVLDARNRLTVAFRFFLALPHLIVVGGPVAAIVFVTSNVDNGMILGYGSAGVLGFAIAIVTAVAWVAILLTGTHPERLWRAGEWYLRWRVRAIAYMTLLRDEYPPFREGDYPAALSLAQPDAARNRLTVAFRFFLALPHLIAIWLLGVAWGLATALAWVMILVTGRFPPVLYGFALGAFAWSVRVEAYVLLLSDEYPPFTLRA
jgi:hypothetical protein